MAHGLLFRLLPGMSAGPLVCVQHLNETHLHDWCNTAGRDAAEVAKNFRDFQVYLRELVELVSSSSEVPVTLAGTALSFPSVP